MGFGRAREISEKREYQRDNLHASTQAESENLQVGVMCPMRTVCFCSVWMLAIRTGERDFLAERQIALDR